MTAGEGAHPSWRLSRWAIEHEKLVIALFALLLIAGVASYRSLPVERFPAVTLPAVAVIVDAGAAQPRTLESQVAGPVERALRHLPGNTRLWSQVTTGRVVTIVQFRSDLVHQPLAEQVRHALSSLTLPSAARPPVVRRLAIDSTPMLAYGLTSVALPLPLLTGYVDATVLPALRRIPGVERAERRGGVTPRLDLVLDPAALRRHGVTPLAVLDGLRANVSHDRDRPRTMARTLETSIASANGGQARLRDLGTSSDGFGASTLALFDAEPAVGVEVVKASGADSLLVDRAVARTLGALASTRPDLGVTKLWSTAEETGAALRLTIRTLVEGGLLATLVVLLFLRNWRATLVVAIALPVAVLPTFAFLVAAGFSLNIVTLLALTMAVGILVDDAIVEMENIQRLIVDGKPPRQAAGEGADGIALAVIATSLAIVAVFTPVSFMPGIGGRFFFEFGLTVSAAVAVSLLVARLLIPVLAARLLTSESRAHSTRLSSAYTRRLRSALDRRRWTITIGLLFIGASVALVRHVPTEFQPLPAPSHYALAVRTEAGARPGALEQLARQAGQVVAARPETDHVFIELGGTPGQGGAAGIDLGDRMADPRSALIRISLKPRATMPLGQLRQALRPALRALQGGEVHVVGPTGTADFQLLLSGADFATLDRARSAIEQDMKHVRGLLDVRRALPAVASPGDADRTASIMPAEAEAAIRLGTIGVDLGKVLSAEDQVVPFHLRIAQDDQAAGLPDVPVKMADSSLASLAAVGPGRQSLGQFILRQGGDRVDGVEADLAPWLKGSQAAGAVARLPSVRRLPPGVRLVPTGDQEELSRLFRSMTIALFVAAGAIYLTLALLFRSVWLPAVVLASLPLALGGAVFSLILFRSAINLPALIGFLLLLGLAAKNSILFVEHAARLQRTGQSLRASLLAAGERRVLAIIMTSVAMTAAMLPAALAVGHGDEFRQPMALAVIGGLVTSTALSLFFVPAVYEALLSRVGGRVRGR